jgi:hypothetical protein
MSPRLLLTCPDFGPKISPQRLAEQITHDPRCRKLAAGSELTFNSREETLMNASSTAMTSSSSVNSSAFWAQYGAYSRFVSPIIGLVWVVVVSRVLLNRIPATRAGW